MAERAFEVIVTMLRNQIREISGQDPHRYLAFVGTLFLFILVSNLLVVFPGYVPPTASLSTTAALAVAVFVAVPVFAITHQGLRTYLRSYLRPNPFMLPFNIISELSHARVGGAPVRQRDELHQDRRHLVGHRAADLPGRAQRAGAAHRRGAGLHLRGAGHRVHLRQLPNRTKRRSQRPRNRAGPRTNHRA